MTKTAIVTGCSSGIGMSVTENLLTGGWNVIGLSRREPDFEADNFRHISVDLTNPTDLEAAIEGVGPVDAIFHAAGLLRVGTHEAMSLADGALMWQLHVACAAQLVQSLAPQMPDGGRIVMIGSKVASGAAGKCLYAASKSALTGFTRSIAAELAPRDHRQYRCSGRDRHTDAARPRSRGKRAETPANRSLREARGDSLNGHVPFVGCGGQHDRSATRGLRWRVTLDLGFECEWLPEKKPAAWQ